MKSSIVPFTTGATVLCLLAAHSVLAQTYSKQFVTGQQLSSASGTPIGVGDLNGDGRPDILYPATSLLQSSTGSFRSVSAGQTFSSAAKLIDVNGDGKLDVVDALPADESCDYNPDGTPYCNIYSDAFLQVYLGNGDGTFKAAEVVDLGQEGSGTATLSVLDLNNDGKPDVTINFTGNSEDSASASSFELFNNGSGVFHTFGTGVPPYSGLSPIVASGDFNGDGKTDLVVNSNSTGLTILFGTGDGTFTTGPNFSTIYPTSAAVGDFDHDGYLDIAVAYTNDVGIYDDGGGTGLFVLYGKGKGQFVAPQKISTLSFNEIIAADVDRDGYLDLVAGGESVAVYTNLHKRTFSNPRVYAGQISDAPPFFPADFNRDGNLDFLVNDTISYGEKGGLFSSPVATLSGLAGSVAVGDFNSDGIEDVAVTNNYYQTVSVFTGSAKGYFNPGVKYATGIPEATAAIGDVNGDGIPDLVVARSSEQNFYFDGPPHGATDLSVLLGNPDGTFRPPIRSSILGPIGYETFNMQTYLVDVNHDGKLDFIGDWGVALGNGDGTFKAPTPFPSPIMQIVGIGVGDFNRDGNVDIVVGEYGYSPNSNLPAVPAIYTLLGDGKGGFKISHTETLGATNTFLTALTTADINGDGNADIVYAYFPSPTSSTGQVTVELGGGDGLFKQSSSTPITQILGGLSTLLVSDFNRDDHQDVVVVTGSPTYYPQTPATADSILLLGDGAGGLGTPQYFSVQSNTGAVIKLNEDDAPDLVTISLFNTFGFERVLNTGKK